MGWVKVVSIFQSGNENERGGRPDDAAAMLQITKVRGTCFAVELPPINRSTMVCTIFQIAK